MKYKECPDCGASLDLGEICECKKENGLPRANGNSPRKDGESLPQSSISQKSQEIKTNPLRDLRVTRNIPAKNMIECVRKLYPKYDKMLQSKCEHGSEYGIDIRPDAMDVLLAEYAPELLESVKRKRRGGHRLTCRITCRLEDAEYAQLTKCIKEDGFDQMQAWLTYVVRHYLKSKAEKGQPNGQL